MSIRPRGLILLVFGAIAVILWWWQVDRAAPTVGDPAPHRAVRTSSPPAPLTREARQKLLRDAPEAHLADDLNLPAGNIRADLSIIASVFAAYRSIYPGRGNPVGDNREITDTLLGRNPNGIIFLQPGHRAINAKGELCDRWGTPFSFHAKSGIRMEVRSAGPDKKMRTPDDVFLVP